MILFAELNSNSLLFTTSIKDPRSTLVSSLSSPPTDTLTFKTFTSNNKLTVFSTHTHFKQNINMPSNTQNSSEARGTTGAGCEIMRGTTGAGCEVMRGTTGAGCSVMRGTTGAGCVVQRGN